MKKIILLIIALILTLIAVFAKKSVTTHQGADRNDFITNPAPID